MLLTLIGMVAGLAIASNKLEQQQQATASHRLTAIGDDIDQALETIRRQHRDNKDYLKKYQLLPLVERHGDFYNTLLGSEQAYTDAIASYQAYIYDIAGRVRGSGEWHSFYTNKLDLFQHRSLNRSRYLMQLKPAAPVTPEQP